VSDFDHAPQRTLADTHGIAVVRTSPRLIVAARSGTAFGLRKFTQAPRGEIRIGLAPGPFVAAKVVTESGAPAPGILVWFEVSPKGGRSNTKTFNVVSRSPDGLAIAHHRGVRREDFPTNEMEVTAGVEGTPSKGGTKATLEQLRSGPITLALGPNGRVTVKLTDPEGNPLLAEARVQLSARMAKATTSFGAIAAAGTADFPFVPLNASLSVSAQTDGLDSITRDKVEVLRTPGEQITIDVRFQRKRGGLKGKAVDDAGNPLDRKTLEAELVHSGGSLLLPSTARVDTGANGEFKLVVDRQVCREASTMELLQRSARGAVERQAIVPIPRLPDAEDADLGEVRFVRPEPLATGVVKDELGAPIAGALVSAEGARQFPMGPQMKSAVAGARFPVLSDRLAARTDEAGAFEIAQPPKGRWAIATFSLRAVADGYVCVEPALNLKPGAKDARIVLGGTGSVEGRLALPEPAPIRKLSLHVALVDAARGGTTTDYRFDDCINSNGTFRVSGIQPGVATVMIRLAGATDPLATISEVTVPRLGVADDARLASIDLREHAALRP
jgi:hypothetical protein